MSLGATPNGITPALPKHIPWLFKDDYISYPTGITISTSDPLYLSGALEQILQGACALVEKICHRYFTTQTVDEQTPNVSIQQGFDIVVPLLNAPITAINSIYIQNYKYFVQNDLSYITVFQNEGYYTFIPYFTGGNGESAIPQGVYNMGRATIWTNYTFGYETVPDPIYDASVLLATRFIAQQENPTGASGSKTGTTMLQWRQMKDQKDPLAMQIEDLLRPYIFQDTFAI